MIKKIFLAISILFVFGCETDNTNDNTVTDIDGNTYPTVTIGSQVWMAKNLDVSRYRNGDPIPQVQDQTEWSNLTTGAWCYYENNTANGPIYGKLYNWYAVNDPRGLAPEGWHVPNNNDWNSMRVFIGCDTVNFYSTEAGKLREVGTTHWGTTHTGVTNETGFTALGAGYRTFDSRFRDLLYDTYWWSGNTLPYLLGITVDDEYCSLFVESYRFGASVRCIKD
jgi:uncharacterized protein (TIGR02145 family)